MEEWEVLEMHMMWNINEGAMESFDALGRSEGTMAILGDTWWPQTTKQNGEKVCHRFSCHVLTRNELPSLGASIRSRNGALPRDERLISSNDQGKQRVSTPSP